MSVILHFNCADNEFLSQLTIDNRSMANQTNNSISLVAECLDYTLHSLICGKFSSVEGKSYSLNLN